MFNNILHNPTLAGFTLNRVHTDRANNQRPVEYPDGWEQISWHVNSDDPDEVPASFHRDVGYGLAAGFMKWEGGYVQRGVQLRGGQRYLAKALFNVNMAFHQTPPPEDGFSHIQWRFLFNDQGYQVESVWESTYQNRWGADEEALFVVEAVNDIVVDFGLIFRSIHPSTAGEIHIKSIELLDVPADYGTPVIVGKPDDAISETFVPAPPEFVPNDDISASTASTDSADFMPAPPEFVADADPSASTIPSPTAGNITVSSLIGAMADDDLQVIVNGFRAASRMPEFSSEVAAGFVRFAEVLERLGQ
ncbi:MAG: hypothetical protein RLP44_11260 [Aggregatilineales bacterium]